MTRRTNRVTLWGKPPWTLDFRPTPRRPPDTADFVVVGGGYSGLTAAAWLRRLAPEKLVLLLEGDILGSGASGRTGGIALAESAAGDLPGLGDVLGGFARILSELEVNCDFEPPGVWEIGRRGGRADSPLAWQDSGTLRVVNEVPGGTVDPGKLVAGLARAAEHQGVTLCENARVQSMRFGEPIELDLAGTIVHADKILFATGAQSLRLSGLDALAEPKFTLAVATVPVGGEVLEAIGLGQRKAFYTLDLPYLWGRVLTSTQLVFGSGLVHLEDSEQFAAIDVSAGPAEELLRSIERRVRGLHPALASVEFAHRWGGPILFGNDWRPFLGWHPQSRDAIVLGAFSGQGVTLSVYLGCWAAEALLGKRELPVWGAIPQASGGSGRNPPAGA